VAAYYYLRVIKIMYFDELAEGFEPSKGWELPWIMAVSALAILLFFILPGPLFSAAEAAAVSLFGG
jgi:NADH-quinone oxidoreductase subunit N